MRERDSAVPGDAPTTLTTTFARLAALPQSSRVMGLAMALTLLKIAKLRLFETGSTGPAMVFESPLPSPNEFERVWDELNRADFEVRDATAQYGLGERAERDTDVQRVLSSLGDALAHSPELASLARNTSLDVTVDDKNHSWSMDFTTDPDLRGENLSEASDRPSLDVAPIPTPDSEIPTDAYLSAAAAAELLGVAKSTVTRRVERNEMIGFRLFKQALCIPREQFMDYDVIPGIREVLCLFALSGKPQGQTVDHKGTWLFLSTDLYRGDSDPRPIDRLRTAARRHTTDVVVAGLRRAKQSIDRGDHL